MYIDCSAVIFVRAVTEVETLKKALAEAEERAAKEQAIRKKHKAGLGRFSRSSRTL